MNEENIVLKTFDFMRNPLWKVTDNSLALGGVSKLVSDFIQENFHDDYTLCIYDTIQERSVNIECNVDEIPQIVEYVYHLEQATPLTLIGVNPLTDCYMVYMRLTRGRIEFTTYKTENGKLIKLHDQID